MTDQSTRTDHKPVWMAERAIVLQVLRNDHTEGWSCAELGEQVSDLDPLAVSDALARLAEEGVVILGGENVEASRCARRMDHLELVSI